MLDKRTRTLIFLEAAMIVTIVFILSIALTHYLDNWRMQDLDKQIAHHELHHNSFLVANSFFETIGIEDCEFSQKMILNEYEVIKELGEDVNLYKLRILKRNEEIHDLRKREYLIIQVENLNKVFKHNERCEEKIYPLLYFLDGEITGFDAQGLLLQQFEVSNDDVLLYNIDINYRQEISIDLLMKEYNVTRHGIVQFGNLSNHEGGSVNVVQLLNELERLRGE